MNYILLGSHGTEDPLTWWTPPSDTREGGGVLSHTLPTQADTLPAPSCEIALYPRPEIGEMWEAIT